MNLLGLAGDQGVFSEQLELTTGNLNRLVYDDVNDVFEAGRGS